MAKNASDHKLKEAEKDEVMDDGRIAEAQRVEHYKIAGAGTAVRYAKQSGLNEIAKMLQTTFDEAYAANEKLDGSA